MAGKVTAGLASHWQCITDFSGYPATGSMAYEREMSTPLYKLLQGVGTAFIAVTLLRCSVMFSEILVTKLQPSSRSLT